MAERTEDDLILEIAEQIEMNRLGYKEKTDEEKAELLPGIKVAAVKKLQDISLSFNKIVSQIGEEVPEKARLSILTEISEKVTSDDGFKTIDSAFSVEAVHLAESIVAIEKERIIKEDLDDEVADLGFIIPGEFILGEDANEDKGKENIPNPGDLNLDFDFSSNDDMKEEQKNIENLLETIGREEINGLIEQANNGDLRAKTIIVAMMTSLSYSKSTKKFEEMSAIDKVDALQAIAMEAFVAQEYGDSQSRILSVEIARNLGLEHLLKKDENGHYFIDQESFEDFCEKNGVNASMNKEGLENNGRRYANLEDFEDLMLESKIEKVKMDIFNNIILYKSCLEKGLANADDYIRCLDDMFKENYDAAIRAMEIFAGDTSKNPEVRKFLDAATIKVLEIYRDGKDGINGLDVDQYVDKTMESIIKSTIERMSKTGTLDKDIIDLMLKVSPEITQICLKQAKEEQIVEETTDTKIQKEKLEEKKETVPDEKEEHKKSIRRDLKDMNEYYGLEKALNLGYEFMFGETASKSHAKEWLEVMQECFDIENIKNGTSIIKLEDVAILEKHVQEILKKNSKEQSPMLQRYIIGINNSVSEIRGMSKDKSFLDASKVSMEDVSKAVMGKKSNETYEPEL